MLRRAKQTKRQIIEQLNRRLLGEQEKSNPNVIKCLEGKKGFHSKDRPGIGTKGWDNLIRYYKSNPKEMEDFLLSNGIEMNKRFTSNSGGFRSVAENKTAVIDKIFEIVKDGKFKTIDDYVDHKSSISSSSSWTDNKIEDYKKGQSDKLWNLYKDIAYNYYVCGTLK